MRIKSANYQSVYESFPEKYIDVISGYIERINSLFQRYDVVIFMARKAYCFYLALKHKGLITNLNSCTVMSSRSLSYSIEGKLQGKRIALVDDIVVRGKTLEETFNRLTIMGLDKSVDVYIAACRDDTIQEVANNACKELKGPYVHLDETSILELTKCITTYISLSTVSYNMDSPRYDAIVDDFDVVRWIIRDHGCVNISMPHQKLNEIFNYVVHFKSDLIFELFDSVQISTELAKQVILKFRLLFDNETNALTVLPVVVFPALSAASIKALFSRLVPQSMQELVTCSYNLKITLRNMMSMLQYQLGKILAKEILIARYDIGLEFDYDGECALFGGILDEVENEKFLPENCWELYQKSPYIDGFDMTELVGATYDFILNGESKVFIDCLGQQKENRFFTLEEYSDAIDPEKQIDPLVISTIVDMFVDKGLIIPEFLFTQQDKLVRAFRTGEIMLLTHKELRLFASFINSYYRSVDRYLNRIELEKLCVIFYRYCHHQSIFRRSVMSDPNNTPEDYYGICYSLFGPRISSSSCQYEVQNEESCISKHMLKNGYISVDKAGKYYSQFEITVPDSYQQYDADILLLAMITSKLTKSLELGGTGIPESLRRFVSTPNDLLTLIAIGNSEKDQVLSLIAEIRLFANLAKSFDNSTFVTYLSSVMSAVWNGVWKYICYRNLNVETDCVRPVLIGNVSEYVCFKSAISTRIDNNPDISTFLDVCGAFLIRCAQFYEAVKESGSGMGKKIPTYINSLDLPELRKENHLSYTSDELPTQFLILRNEALALIDICNLYLDENAMSYQTLQSVYVVHSRCAIPEMLLHDAHKIDFQDRDFDSTHLVVLWMDEDKQSCKEHLEYILNRCDGTDVQIFKCNLSSWFEAVCCCPQTYKARGNFFARLIRSVLEHEKQYVGSKSEVLLCKKKTDEDIVLDLDFGLMFCESYSIGDDYVVNRYAINTIKEGQKVTINTINFTQNGNGNNMTPIVNPTEKVEANQQGMNFFIGCDQNIMSELETIKRCLETGEVKVEEKEEIVEAINEFETAPADKKQSLWKKALEKIAKLGESVLTKLSASLILEYIKQFGQHP